VRIATFSDGVANALLGARRSAFAPPHPSTRLSASGNPNRNT
jgi:hypothetical protein